MTLHDLKKLTGELELLVRALGSTKTSQGRIQIHKRAFSIIREIEKGSGAR